MATTTTTQRKPSNTTKLAARSLLNSMTPEECKQLYDTEVLNRSRPDKKRGCIMSTRAVGPKAGGYPRLQIPYHLVPPEFADKCNDGSKGQLKVFLHQLAWRATGHLLPSYESNHDLAHICGQGRRTSRQSGCCFNKDHLAVVSHAINMRRCCCIPTAKCPNCLHTFSICPHTPPHCKGGRKKWRVRG